MASVLIFGDELGIPLVLSELPASIFYQLVYDPKRAGMFGWIKGHYPEKFLAHPAKENRSHWLSQVSSKKFDLGIIASYSRVLWTELLEVFPCGVVNLHFGKLPEYRGANTLQWAILEGEKETAVTLHYADDEIDAGPVIESMAVSVEDNDTARTLQNRMIEKSKGIFAHWIPKLLEGKVKAQKQDGRKAKTWPRRRQEDGEINWTWSAQRIRNYIRALSDPWPGAYYVDQQNRKIVLKQVLSIDEIEALKRKNTAPSL